MNTKINLVMLGVLLALTGCGSDKGNSSAYQSGSDYCSQEYVNAYNNVQGTVKSTDSVATANSAIDSFESQYRGVNCKANNLTNGGDMYANADDLIRRMRAAVAAYASTPRATKRQVMTTVPGTGSTPVATGNPRAAAIDANIAELKAVSVEVLDASPLNGLKNSNGDAIVQNGKVFRVNQITDLNSNLCFMAAVRTSDFVTGLKLEFTQVAVKDDGSLKLSNNSNYLNIVCMRRDGKHTPWTVSEIQSIFGTLANINPIR